MFPPCSLVAALSEGRHVRVDCSLATAATLSTLQVVLSSPSSSWSAGCDSPSRIIQGELVSGAKLARRFCTVAHCTLQVWAGCTPSFGAGGQRTCARKGRRVQSSDLKATEGERRRPRSQPMASTTGKSQAPCGALLRPIWVCGLWAAACVVREGREAALPAGAPSTLAHARPVAPALVAAPARALPT